MVVSTLSHRLSRPHFVFVHLIFYYRLFFHYYVFHFFLVVIQSNIFFLPHEDKALNTKEIISNSDLVIAEVSLPATGQGIELGWADYAKIPILCIYEKGTKISSSLKFITNNFIEYEDTNDMINKIRNFITER